MKVLWILWVLYANGDPRMKVAAFYGNDGMARGNCETLRKANQSQADEAFDGHSGLVWRCEKVQ